MELEIDELRRILKETEGNLIQSAQHGKDLLEENIELKNRIRAENESSLAKIETLEQERYNLRNRLEGCQKSEETLHDEVEALRDQCSKEVRIRTEELMRENATLVQRIRELQDEVEQCENSRTDLQRRLSELLVQNESLSTSVREKTAVASDVRRWHQLEEEIRDTKQKNELYIERIEAKEKEVEAKDKETKLNLDQLRDTIKILEDRLVDKEIKLADYINTSEKYRDEIEDLRMEIQAARMQETDPNRRGNSLFSEVDDYRQRLETNMKSLKLKYDNLRRENQSNLSRIAFLQKQMAGIAAAASTKVSASHVNSLEQKLALLQKEMQIRITREEAHRKASPFVVDASENKNEDQFNYLKIMLKQEQSKNERLEKELNQEKMKWLNESQQERLTLHNQIRAEQRSEAVWAENLRLKAEIDELQRKCGEYKENEPFKVIEKINISGENMSRRSLQNVEECQSSDNGHHKKRTGSLHEPNVGKTIDSGTVARAKPQKSKKCVPLNAVSITKESNECNQQ